MDIIVGLFICLKIMRADSLLYRLVEFYYKCKNLHLSKSQKLT